MAGGWSFEEGQGCPEVRANPPRCLSALGESAHWVTMVPSSRWRRLRARSPREPACRRCCTPVSVRARTPPGPLTHQCLSAERSPDSIGNLLILLFSFQFSFFLGSMLGRFLLFLLAFIFASLVTHICSSLPDNGLHRTEQPITRSSTIEVNSSMRCAPPLVSWLGTIG